MKKTAIIQIVIWSVVLVLLLGVLAAYLLGGFQGWAPFHFSINSGFHYQDASSYSIGSCTINEAVSDLNIRWINGSVTIDRYDGKEISVTEERNLQEDDQLRWHLQDGVLTIQPRKAFWFLRFHSFPEKNLVIRIPADWSTLNKVSIDVTSSTVDLAKLGITQLDIDGVSGTVTLSDLQTQEMKIDTVSGGVLLNNVAGNSLKIDEVSGEVTCRDTKLSSLDCDTVSGSTSFSGSLENLNYNAISGNVKIECDQQLRQIHTDTVSGSLAVTMPEGTGFTAKMDSVSGSFSSDFPLVIKEDQRIYGDGSADYSFDSVSGDVTLLKK